MSGPSHASDHAHSARLPQLLELDAVIHASLVSRAVQIAGQHAAATDITTVLDIGAGTGVGTFALAAEYPGARVVAIDTDPDMLDAIRHRADKQHIGDRISTIRADFAGAVFEAGTADMVWSSNAMHEAPKPAAAFGNIFRSLRRAGLLLVMEMDAPPLVLPQRYTSLERTLRAAAGADTPAPDWSDAIAAAGFEILATRSLTSDQLLPAGGPGGSYAALELRRLAQHALPELTVEAGTELRALVVDLTDRHERLESVHIRGTRTLWVARRA